MSLTSLVPAVVPSLFHSSRPPVPSYAVKNSVPLTFVRLLMELYLWLGGRPLTRTVPLAVPSLFHNSKLPCQKSPVVKNSVPFTLVRLPAPPTLRGTVPATVPSLLYS